MSEKKKPRRVWLRNSGIILALLLAGGLVFWLTLPDVTWLIKKNPTETAMMKFRAEQARQKGRKARRCWRRVPLSRISPYLIQAVLIAEDDKFFEHEGFDWDLHAQGPGGQHRQEARAARRLDHHPAAGQEPLSRPRPEHLAQAARSGHRHRSWKGN